MVCWPSMKPLMKSYELQWSAHEINAHTHAHIVSYILYIHVYIYIHMAVDLKVLVRSFNCENRACYVGNPRESFFFEFAKDFFYSRKFRESWILWLIMLHYIPPPAAQSPAGEWYRTIGSSHASWQPHLITTLWPKKGFRVNTESHVNWDAIDTIPKIGTHQCWWSRALCEDRIIFRGPKSQGTLSPWRHARRRGAYTIVHNEGRLLHFDNHLTMGGIACAMSHRLALKALVAHPTVAWTNIHGSYVEKGWKEMSCVWLGFWRISSNRTPVKLWDSGAAVGCCLLGNWTFAETNPQVKPIFKSSQLTNFLQHMFLPHPFPPWSSCLPGQMGFDLGRWHPGSGSSCRGGGGPGC